MMSTTMNFLVVVVVVVVVVAVGAPERVKYYCYSIYFADFVLAPADVPAASTGVVGCCSAPRNRRPGIPRGRARKLSF